ncbi:MAG: ATP-binding protein [Treponema sp.]|nr:ATP-binding protein [Treponema sp.]
MRRNSRSSKNNEDNKAIHLKIFVVVIAAAVIINTVGLVVGAVLLERSVRTTVEDNLLVAVDITAKYVTNEIELLKLRAAKAAREIQSFMERTGSLEDISGLCGGECLLARIRAEHPMYIGLAIFDGPELLFYSDGLVIQPDLRCSPFMQVARDGRQGLSTTKHTPDGTLLMLVSTPISDNLVLVAVLPGLYLSDLMYQFTFWHSGRMFISDAEGTIVSSIRREWVQQRVNLVHMAAADRAYEGLSAMAKRGIAGERGVAYFNLDGVPQICTFRPLAEPIEDWFLGVIAPVNESALGATPYAIFLMGVITMSLSIVAAVGAATLLKRPYNEANFLRREAEIASLSKSTFLANMSHEIRTPMNSIMGFSELALDGEVSPRTRDYLDKIYTNAEWLLHIINDILDISKVESGKMELEDIPFDMQKLFTSCRTLIAPKAREKGLELHFYAEPVIGKMPRGDPTRLRQILVNLLSNAVKFSDSGPIKLYAVTRNISAKNIVVYFEVRDSGIGMSSEQVKIIFDPFMQAESGTTRKYGGTGLGLAITKNIVELMGGKLFVESTPGVGSKFSFELTFETVDVTDSEMLEKQKTFSTALLEDYEKPIFEGEVLLCEDNVMNQQVICEHLARVGLKTVVAGNGKIGLEMIQGRIEEGKKQFDLIFMDMHMPVMDGLEASAKILTLNIGIPIIALTANIMANDMELYRQSGINDSVGKPFTSQELWYCLMKYFKPTTEGHADMQNKDSPLEADMDFQRNLQKMFVRNNQTKYEEIAQALEQNDIKLAHRLAHNLKSNAGHLGKVLLQQAAAKVEQYLEGGKNMVVPEQMAVLERELKAVFVEFEKLFDEAARAKEAQAAPDEPLAEQPPARELLEKLEPMLKMGNPECMKLISSLRLLPDSEELILRMEDFDFDQAAAALADLKTKICSEG